MLELTCGRLVGSWITGTERKHSDIFSLIMLRLL